jgi:hypothetical protein
MYSKYRAVVALLMAIFGVISVRVFSQVWGEV